MQVNFNTVITERNYWMSDDKVLPVTVPVTELSVIAFVDDQHGGEFGELTVSIADWSEEDGLLYGNEQFEAQLRSELAKLGFSEEALKYVGYSEQGKQGPDTVSCDVGNDFIVEYRKISGEAVTPITD